MKNLIICLFAVIAVNAMAFIGPVDRSANLSYDGTAINGTLEKHFMNVVNGSGGQLASGSVVVMSTTADDGFTVTTSTTQKNVPVCIMRDVCAASALCACQVYGLANALLDSVAGNSATAGERFYLSGSNAGYISGVASQNGAQAAGGVFLDSSVASGSIKVFILGR